MATPATNPRQTFGLAIATVFGIGYAPVAPGTFGSAAGLLVWWLLPHSAVVQAFAIVTIFLAGSWGGSVAERHFGRTDPGQVVIDEVMGSSAATRFATLLTHSADVGRSYMRDNGVRIVDPSPAQREVFRLAVEPAAAAVVARLAARGLPAREVSEALKAQISCNG